MLYVFKVTCFVLGVWCQREITISWEPSPEPEISYLVMYEDAPCAEKNNLTQVLMKTTQTTVKSYIPADPQFVRCFTVKAVNAEGYTSEDAGKIEAHGIVQPVR